jgi:hypothetical protein
MNLGAREGRAVLRRRGPDSGGKPGLPPARRLQKNRTGRSPGEEAGGLACSGQVARPAPLRSLAEPPIPRDLAKVSQPPYGIETPDVLAIDAVRVVPLPPSRLEAFDAVILEANNLLPEETLAGLVGIEPDGTNKLSSPGARSRAGPGARCLTFWALWNRLSADLTFRQTRHRTGGTIRRPPSPAAGAWAELPAAEQDRLRFGFAEHGVRPAMGTDGCSPLGTSDSLFSVWSEKCSVKESANTLFGASWMTGGVDA